MATPLIPQKKEEKRPSRKDFLSSLPKDTGWRFPHLFQYRGSWYASNHLQGAMACNQNFQAQDGDIILATMPKSGTTWLKALAFAIVNRSRLPYTHHPLLTTNPHDLVPYLELTLYADNPNPDLTGFLTPRLFATHLPLVVLPESTKISNSRFVYLCRNPKDTFISLWHFVCKLTTKTIAPLPLEDAFELFCKGAHPFGPFWEHALGYWKESLEKPQKVLFLKFEELKGEPSDVVKKLAQFLGYPFSLEEEKQGVVEETVKLCSFENLSNLEVNKSGSSHHVSNSALFRRGEVGDWVNYFTPQMIEQLDRIVEEKLKGSGLTFQES